MKQIDYKGIYPAFCACYDDVGNISAPRAQALARHLQAAGVQGLYVNGSTGECVYLSVEERMQMLEAVMDDLLCVRAEEILQMQGPDTKRAVNLDERFHLFENPDLIREEEVEGFIAAGGRKVTPDMER